MHNIQSVLAPIVRDVVPFKRLDDDIRDAGSLWAMAKTYNRQDGPAGIIDADPERFENLDLRIISGGVVSVMLSIFIH